MELIKYEYVYRTARMFFNSDKYRQKDDRLVIVVCIHLFYVEELSIEAFVGNVKRA